MWWLLLLVAWSSEPTPTVLGQAFGPGGSSLRARVEGAGTLVAPILLSGCTGAGGAARIDGSFAFPLRDSGGCTLTITAPGYRAARVDLRGYDGRTLKVVLQPEESSAAVVPALTVPVSPVTEPTTQVTPSPSVAAAAPSAPSAASVATDPALAELIAALQAQAGLSEGAELDLSALEGLLNDAQILEGLEALEAALGGRK
jgi:hypothetical protein